MIVLSVGISEMRWTQTGRPFPSHFVNVISVPLKDVGQEMKNLRLQKFSLKVEGITNVEGMATNTVLLYQYTVSLNTLNETR